MDLSAKRSKLYLFSPIYSNAELELTIFNNNSGFTFHNKCRMLTRVFYSAADYNNEIGKFNAKY